MSPAQYASEGLSTEYAHLRPRHYSIEFAVVVFLKALPGLVVYYLLMRNEVVHSRDIVPSKLS